MRPPDSPIAVVGQVEWVEFGHIARYPTHGSNVDVTPIMDLAAGGGANVAVELAHLAGRALLFTALGDDELGHRALAELERQGLDVHVAWREQPTQRTLCLIDPDGERSNLHIGRPLQPSGDDLLPWDLLAGTSAVYFCAGDAGALTHARRSPTLVVSPRARCLSLADITPDALTYSVADKIERDALSHIRRMPRFVIETSGPAGCRYWTRDDFSGGLFPAAPVQAPLVDTYGCGDAFAAAVTFGLAIGLAVYPTLALATRQAASCLTRPGPRRAPGSNSAPRWPSHRSSAGSGRPRGDMLSARA